MNVASLGLCKELYELSGWRGTEHIEFADNARDVDDLPEERTVPLYPLGYLLRKLPDGAKLERQNRYLPIEQRAREQWVIEPGDLDQITAGTETVTLPEGDLGDEYMADVLADTPEDAACKLAIELFKQGILTKEAA